MIIPDLLNRLKPRSPEMASIVVVLMGPPRMPN